MTSSKLAPTPTAFGGSAAVVAATDSYPGMPGDSFDRLADAGFPIRHVRVIGSDSRAWSR